MPRCARRHSSTDIYHVINRGSGGRIIFETDRDRLFFMAKLSELLAQAQGELLAWCLMDNHFHLLLQLPFDALSTLMHRLETSYVGRFNSVNGHTGVLFGSRFKSEPVESERYLMAVVRYIHENPIKAGLSRGLEYRWSSYEEFTSRPIYTNTSIAFDVFGDREQFVAFHKRPHRDPGCLDFVGARRRIDDQQARRIAELTIGRGVIDTLKNMAPRERCGPLARLKEAGLGVRQIGRLTGVPLAAISRAA